MYHVYDTDMHQCSLIPVQPWFAEHGVVCQEHFDLALCHVGDQHLGGICGLGASQGGQVLHDLSDNDECAQG